LVVEKIDASSGVFKLSASPSVAKSMNVYPLIGENPATFDNPLLRTISVPKRKIAQMRVNFFMVVR
jgi:hypothetical protein